MTTDPKLLQKMLDNADRIALPCPVCGAARGKQCIGGPRHAGRPVGRAIDLRNTLRSERTVVASGRRHDVPGCPRCDREPTVYHPSHDASSRCESGGREHCSCDVCF